MKDIVVIKGNKYGLALCISEEASLTDIKKDLLSKLVQAKKFFKEGDIAVSFEGQVLDDNAKQELITLIREHSNLNVVCIMDTSAETEQRYKTAIDAAKNGGNISSNPGTETNVGSFHKGTLRSGQLLESETSVVIIGDVNPGASIVAKGNIVVLGSLKGNAYAGANGDTNSFVVALKMNAMQIRIADTIARCPDNHETSNELQPQIAYISEDNICIENIC